jgi:hypothetical protein
MELFVETHMRSDDCQKEMQQFIDSRDQHFLVRWFSIIFFLSYYLLEFDDFIFYFHETYNSWLKERHGDDPSINPDFDLDLWLEARSSDGPDRNRVYKLSNTTAENLWTTYSVSTVGCSHSIPSTQSLEFVAFLDQRVQKYTAHLNENYELFSVNYEELCQMVMDTRSQMSGTCVPFYWPHSSGNDQPLPSLVPLLF